MGQLTVENLFDDTSLTLEVGKATFGIDDDTLTIEVIFPKYYKSDDFEEDEETGELINLPKDYWFKDSKSKLELELPISDFGNEIIGKEIFIDSENEDNEDLTNFLIANTHYPTFDDKILITKTNDKYLLKWSGLLPDIKNSRYEIYMKTMFKFSLETECEQID